MEQKIWEPRKAAGLWCVGGIGADNWRLGRTSEKPVPVADRLAILKKAGLEGYSGHIGANYEFNLDDSNAPNAAAKIKKRADDIGLVCVDIVGSEFKTERVRDGSFTSEDPEVRQYISDNLAKAGDLAMDWGVKTIRVWDGSDGINGPFQNDRYAALQRTQDILQAFLEKYPSLVVSIEGKPGEPMNFQTIGGTGNGIALCMALNNHLHIPFVNGSYKNARAVIGPELNHEFMNGEDGAEGIAQAIMYGVMGDVHAGDGVFRMARDCDQQMGKWNPGMCFEVLAALQDGYAQGKYDSKWIILDQNASMYRQGPQQVDHLRLSRNFIDAGLHKATDRNFRAKLFEFRKQGDYASLDRLVMGATGEVMAKAAAMYTPI